MRTLLPEEIPLSAVSSARNHAFSAIAFLSIAAGASAPVAAQCGPLWQAGAPASGPGGNVWDAALMPNGDIVAVGDFLVADAALTSRVARFDGTTWQSLGTGLAGAAYAVVAMPNGDVVAAGSFQVVGTSVMSRIARWNGTTWSPLGSGLSDQVNTLLVMPNGDLIAGGRFTSAGGVAASRIARWDGTSWSALGVGVSGEVHCLALRANGDLIVGGAFQQAGGVASPGLATWNGASWNAVPGLVGGTVLGVAGLPNNDIAVAGNLTIGVAFHQVAVANGTTVQPLTPPAATWNEVVVLQNGDILIGGYSSGMAGEVARWNGTVWTSFGNGAPGRTMKFLLPANGDIVAAGVPIGTGVTASNAVARYNGTSWASLGAPRPPKINAMVTMRSGDVILGGEFTTIRGVAANNIVRWRDGVASPLGLGVSGPVTCMSVATDGSLVVCGQFVGAGAGPAAYIARWTGTAWTSVGSGLPFVATSVAAGSGGQVIARATSLLIRYFDGSSWSPLVLPYPFYPLAIAAAPEGDFILGGLFQAPTGNIGTIRFANGVASPTGPLPYSVSKLANDGNGKVLALASPLGSNGEILRLDGNTWSSLGGSFPQGNPLTMSSLPNGDPLVVAYWLGSAAAITRFDGTTWSVMEPQIVIGSMNLPIASSGSGELLLGGDVWRVNGMASTALAVSTATCPSAALPIGAGCTGAAGPLTLAADNLPWLGGTFRSTASGFTATSLGLHAIGTQPLAVALPLGAPGCSLFVQPILLDLLLPGSGTATATFAVPRAASLAGLQVRTQVVGVELDAAGNLIQLTSTNALQLTIGGL
jgi:hypothetical protein